MEDKIETLQTDPTYDNENEFELSNENLKRSRQRQNQARLPAAYEDFADNQLWPSQVTSERIAHNCINDYNVNERAVGDSATNNGNSNMDSSIISFSQLNYGIHAFYAMVKPVTITMILTALSVVIVTTEEISEQKSQQMSQAYTVWDVSSATSQHSSTTGRRIGFSIANGLIIIAVIIVMTFIMVLLYKYRCLKLLMGYLGFSVIMLLGVLGYDLLVTAFTKFQWVVDVASLFFFLYNFAIVGFLTLFFGNTFRSPKYITQGYLICISLFLAWQLAYFDPWTAWVLLILLAFYDLYAVLTPCGPLKFLVNLMSKEDAPTLPAILYEASLPPDAQRPNRTPRSNADNGRATNYTVDSPRSRLNRQQNNNLSHEGQVEAIPTSELNNATNDAEATTISHEREYIPEKRERAHEENPLSPPNLTACAMRGDIEMTIQAPIQQYTQTEDDKTKEHQCQEQIRFSQNYAPSNPRHAAQLTSSTSSAYSSPTGMIPLALARFYRLPIVDDDTGRIVRSHSKYPNLSEMSPGLLQSKVRAVFPLHGGKIEVQERQNAQQQSTSSTSRQRYRQRRRERNDEEPTRYIVKDRHGNIQKVLFVNSEGKVFEVQKQIVDHGVKGGNSNSIKLGLGDFVFYSLLVSKAALDGGFLTFLVCMLIILIGLKSTLVLLAIKGQALPALPISILLGVIFYFLTIYILDPYIRYGILDYKNSSNGYLSFYV